MAQPADILFLLLRAAIAIKDAGSFPSDIDWPKLIDLSFEQGVAALTVDGLGLMIHNSPNLELEIDKEELEDLKYEWFGACFMEEQSYADHLKTIEKLASLYNEHSVRMLLLKGYGLSLNYPVPKHRTSGDIDIYLYGKGGLGDALVRDRFGCEVKQNEDKHSVFWVRGISVENHACFVNDTVHPSLRGLNEFLVDESEKSVVHQIGGASVLLPSAMFDALFIPFHCAGHFVHGEASVRQLCDWACFVQEHGAEVDWAAVGLKAKEAGFWDFLCCLNGIVRDYLGVSSEALPGWPIDVDLEKRVMDEILAPKKSVSSLMGKVHRFFASRWKYRLVYNDSIFLSSLRLAKSYLRRKDDAAESIWEVKSPI